MMELLFFYSVLPLVYKYAHGVGAHGYYSCSLYYNTTTDSSSSCCFFYHIIHSSIIVLCVGIAVDSGQEITVPSSYCKQCPNVQIHCSILAAL